MYFDEVNENRWWQIDGVVESDDQSRVHVFASVTAESFGTKTHERVLGDHIVIGRHTSTSVETQSRRIRLAHGVDQKT